MEFIISNCPQIVVCLIICIAKICEISIQSIKTVFLIKGKKAIAAGLAFIECLIWGLIISSIVTTLGQDFSLLLSYCLGYSAGIFIGSIIENKIALGTCSIQIMAKDSKTEPVLEYLTEKNKGFTVLNGMGSKEKMSIILIFLPRKEVKVTIQEIRKICDNDVFVVHSDISKSIGGYGIRK